MGTGRPSVQRLERSQRQRRLGVVQRGHRGGLSVGLEEILANHPEGEVVLEAHTHTKSGIFWASFIPLWQYKISGQVIT